jgi:hypothetical protein
MELCAKHEQPGPPVRPLEASAIRLAQVGQLSSDLVRRELAIEQRRDARCDGSLGKPTFDRRQEPVCMHRRMPIEAAVEDRVQLAWRLEVLRPVQDMIELVGIFLLDMAQGDRREMCREALREQIAHR